MGVAPHWPNFATDNSFSNPGQATRVQSTWSPFYLSTNLWHVVCRHKFPQKFPIQQGYFPIHVPGRRVSPQLTQSGLSLWSWVGTISSPLTCDRDLSNKEGVKYLFVEWNSWLRWGGALRKRRPMKIKYLAHPIIEHKTNWRRVTGARILILTGIPWRQYPPE